MDEAPAVIGATDGGLAGEDSVLAVGAEHFGRRTLGHYLVI